jgi:hypothetical protein
MSWTLLDSGVAGFADGNSGHVYSFPGGAASAGDLLVLAISSDTVVSTPSGWSLATSDVHNIGAYLAYKVAVGGETSVTVTTSGNFSTEIGFLRYSGAASSPLDVTAKAFNTVSTNTTPAVTTGTLAGSGELVVAAACLGGMGGGTPSGPSWSSGYTNRLDGQTAGTSTQDQHLFVADRYDGSGSESPNVTWTSNANNQTILVAAFLPAAGATGKSDSDTGTSAEAATLTTATAATDSGAATETAALAANTTATDAGAGVDTASLSAASTDADSASGTDAATLTAAAAAADTATGTDSADVAAAFTVTDAGSVTDSAVVSAVQVAADVGAGVESAATTATLAAADTATATEVETLTAGLAAADQATASESAAVGLLTVDTATATDTALLAAALLASDTAHGAESAVLSIVGGSTDITVTAGPPSRGWAAAAPKRVWSTREPHT